MRVINKRAGYEITQPPLEPTSLLGDGEGGTEDVSDAIVGFTEGSDSDIESGTTLSTLFGKIKYFINNITNVISNTIFASASIDNTSGTPTVEVEKHVDGDRITFDFNFSGLKGTKGDNGTDGADGVTPDITITATVDGTTGTPSVNVTKSGTDEEPVFNLAFHGLKGEGGGTGSSIEGQLVDVQTSESYSGDIKSISLLKNNHRHVLAVTVDDDTTGNEETLSDGFYSVPEGEGVNRRSVLMKASDEAGAIDWGEAVDIIDFGSNVLFFNNREENIEGVTEISYHDEEQDEEHTYEVEIKNFSFTDTSISFDIENLTGENISIPNGDEVLSFHGLIVSPYDDIVLSNFVGGITAVSRLDTATQSSWNKSLMNLFIRSDGFILNGHDTKTISFDYSGIELYDDYTHGGKLCQIVPFTAYGDNGNVLKIEDGSPVWGNVEISQNDVWKVGKGGNANSMYEGNYLYEIKKRDYDPNISDLELVNITDENSGSTPIRRFHFIARNAISSGMTYTFLVPCTNSGYDCVLKNVVHNSKIHATGAFYICNQTYLSLSCEVSDDIVVDEELTLDLVFNDGSYIEFYDYLGYLYSAAYTNQNNTDGNYVFPKLDLAEKTSNAGTAIVKVDRYAYNGSTGVVANYEVDETNSILSIDAVNLTPDSIAYTQTIRISESGINAFTCSDPDVSLMHDYVGYLYIYCNLTAYQSKHIEIEFTDEEFYGVSDMHNSYTITPVMDIPNP